MTAQLVRSVQCPTQQGDVLNPKKIPNKWRVVQSSLDSWPRTTRLCLILLIISIPMDATTWMTLR